MGVVACGPSGNGWETGGAVEAAGGNSGAVPLQFGNSASCSQSRLATEERAPRMPPGWTPRPRCADVRLAPCAPRQFDSVALCARAHAFPALPLVWRGGRTQSSRGAVVPPRPEPCAVLALTA